MELLSEIWHQNCLIYLVRARGYANRCQVLTRILREELIRMTGKRSTVILSTVAFIFALVFTGQSAQADWGISYYGAARAPRYDGYGDRIASEYRSGYQVDDWLERGASSITDSLYSLMA